MRGRACGALAIAGLVLLTGCARFAPATAQLIYSLRTDPDHQGLVATYTGGSCDGPARMRVIETAGRVDVAVLVDPDPSGPEVCDDVGISRTVSARLEEPVGDRAIWSQGRRLAAFDGARVLSPATLPDGFSPTGERGDTSDAGVTTSWGKTYEKHPAPLRSRCTPSPGVLVVEVGHALAADRESDWTKVGTARIGSSTTDLYREDGVVRGATPHSPRAVPHAGARQTDGRPVVGWAYVWSADQGLVEVSNQTRCEGDRLLSRAELLTVARSLRPA